MKKIERPIVNDEPKTRFDGFYQLRPGHPLTLGYAPTKKRGKEDGFPPLESFELHINVEDVTLLYGMVAHIGDQTTGNVKVVISFFLPEPENLRNGCGVLLKPNARLDLQEILEDMGDGEEKSRLLEWANDHLCYQSFLRGYASRMLSKELDGSDLDVSDISDFCEGAYDEGKRGRVYDMYHEDAEGHS